MSLYARLGLGVRLALLSGYTNRVRALLLAVTVAVVTLLSLGAASVPPALAAQDERERDRQVIDAANPADALLWAEATDPTFERRWNEHDISRLFVSGQTGAPSPPGVSALPQPGEVYLSPDLRDLMGSDPVVASLFDGYRVVGRVTGTGLTQPHELRAVVGVSRSEPSCLPPQALDLPSGRSSTSTRC